MKTIALSNEEMRERIARYRELKPLPIQQSEIPLGARDVVYARKLLSVIGLEGAQTPINAGAPIRGAAGMTMTLAVCPPGQGPGLHAHRQTYETFTVLKGRFEVTWNDDGSGRAELGLAYWPTPRQTIHLNQTAGEASSPLPLNIKGG